MNNVIKEINIELYSPTSYEIIHAQQGDNQLRLIKFSLFNQGEPYTIPSGTNIRMEGHRGDNSSFIKENCTVSNNIITAILDSDILSDAGIAEARIVLRDSYGGILSTIPFKINIHKDPSDKDKIESEKRSLIDDLILLIDTIKNRFETHINDKIAHFSNTEHERFNQMTNEILVAYNGSAPDYLQAGDYYLQEYR